MLDVYKKRVLPIKDKLFRFALRYLGDEEEARDIVQDVLIKVWDKRGKWAQIRNMEAWCMTITRNYSLNRMRNKNFHSTEYLTDQHQPLYRDSQTPERQAEQSEMMQHIHELINRLPEKQKAVIQLRDVEGYSYDEIAEIMETDLNNVKVNLFRARQHLKKELVKIQNYGLSESRRTD
jgi:RNA polymerase sigma-70 factor (family 1)